MRRWPAVRQSRPRSTGRAATAWPRTSPGGPGSRRPAGCSPTRSSSACCPGRPQPARRGAEPQHACDRARPARSMAAMRSHSTRRAAGAARRWPPILGRGRRPGGPAADAGRRHGAGARGASQPRVDAGAWRRAAEPSGRAPPVGDGCPPAATATRPTRFGAVRRLERTLLDTNLRLSRELRALGPRVRLAGRDPRQRPGPPAHHRGPRRPRRAPRARRASPSPCARPTAPTQTQVATFASWVARSGYEQALKFSARPGHSEHQLGTTIDFTTAPGVPLSTSFGESPAGKLAGRQQLALRLHHVVSQGHAARLLLRLRAVALPLRRP